MRRPAIALVALALLAATCGGGTESGLQETAPVTITGDPLPLLPETGADPAQGMTMPEVDGQSFDGTPVAIANDGQPKILLFLAHW